MDVSSASDVVAIFSLPLTVIATISAAVAAWFAGKAINDSTKQRKQDLRFMYAQRAVKLSDMLVMASNDLMSIEKALTRAETSHINLALLASLPLETLIHEAKICSSLAKASGVSKDMSNLIKYLEIFKGMQVKKIASDSKQKVGEPSVDCLIWTDGYDKIKVLKKCCEERHLYQSFVGHLNASIQEAYQVKL